MSEGGEAGRGEELGGLGVSFLGGAARLGLGFGLGPEIQLGSKMESGAERLAGEREFVGCEG